MTTEQKVQEAMKLFKQFSRLQRYSSQAWWLKAEILHNLKKKGLFRYVYGGEDFTTFNSFCAEIDMPVSTVNYMVDMYETFVVRMGYDIKYLAENTVRYKLQYAKKIFREALAKNEIREDIILNAAPVSKGGLSFSDFRQYLEEKYKNGIREQEGQKS